jgi:spore germination protein
MKERNDEFFKMKLYHKLCTLLLILTLSMVTHPYGNVWAESKQPFDDISNSYAQSQILDLYNRNMINGTDYRKFDPNKPITRSEFITILDRILNIQPANSDIAAFLDVSKDSWFYGSVQAGVELGIIDGTTPYNFAPNHFITRQEASALLIRALKQNAMHTNSVSLPFDDANLVSSWAIPYVDRINSLDLMSGYQREFRPNESITRQETAVVLDKLLTIPRWSNAINSSSKPLIQLGWQYNDTTVEFEQKVSKSDINTLSPRWFFLGKDLGFDDEVDVSLISWAKQNNKKIWAMVGNHSDKETTHQLLSQPDKTAMAIKQLTTYVQKYQIDGLNLDFENVDASDKNLLSSFIKNLAEEMHTHNTTLSINVSPDTGTDWTDAFDYSEIGKSADYTVVMAYDEHWDGDENAGSVSSLPWFRNGIEKLMAVVPAEKVIVALPLYTQEWIVENGITSNQELSIWQQNNFINATGLFPTWDPIIGQYRTDYTLDNQQHSIWLEDSRSLALKFQTAATNGIAGFAYWYMGSESPDVWISLRNMLTYSSYKF